MWPINYEYTEEPNRNESSINIAKWTELGTDRTRSRNSLQGEFRKEPDATVNIEPKRNKKCQPKNEGKKLLKFNYSQKQTGLIDNKSKHDTKHGNEMKQQK